MTAHDFIHLQLKFFFELDVLVHSLSNITQCFSYLDSAVIGGSRCETFHFIALARAAVDEVHRALYLSPVQPVFADLCTIARRALRI